MKKSRARDFGIPFEGTPGIYNAITDVAGITVGYSTIIENESARTGVTIIHPRGKENHEPVFGSKKAAFWKVRLESRTHIPLGLCAIPSFNGRLNTAGFFKAGRVHW